MPVPLPNLDRRRWLDLVDEGRALIPRHAPGWTDFNVHDPGITLIELIAWQIEQELYRSNRVTARQRAKFLALVGFRPQGATPARVVLVITPSATGGGTVLPAGLGLSMRGGQPLTFRTRAPIRLFGGRLVAVASASKGQFTDLTGTVGKGQAVEPLSPDPGLGSALYLGLDAPLQANLMVSLWLSLEGPGTTMVERARVAAEQKAREADRTKACRPPGDAASCEPPAGAGTALDEFESGLASGWAATAATDRATVAWEYWNGGEWRTLDPANGEVVDETDGLLYSAAVRLRPPTASAARTVGTIPTPAHFVRLRQTGGRFDAVPLLRRVDVDAVEALQHEPAWSLVAPVDRSPHPQGGQGVVVGTSDGDASQSFDLPGTAVAADEVRVWVVGSGGPVRWRTIADLDASAPDARDVVLDGHAVRFGDGRRGAVPERGAGILVDFDATAGSLGTGPPSSRWELPDGDLNESVLGSAAAVAAARLAVGSIANPEPAAGGADREDLEHVAGRAAERQWAHERLVELAEEAGVSTLDRLGRRAVLERSAPPRATTLLDLERLALDLPGGRVARSRAFTGVDPDAPCRNAPGTVTVVAIPWLPHGRPEPTRDLLGELAAYLERRRVVGMRLMVLGPRYVEIGIEADVAVAAGNDAAVVREDIGTALARFLDPLEGGADGLGWPFGRDVYRAEILAAIDGVTGVDHVVRLRITATPVGERGTGGAAATEPSCGNVCLGPARLPVMGWLAIEAVA